MHEFALYGQVTKDDHHRMLQQLAGYTRMQPQDVVEIHLTFKARQPPGLDNVPSAGGSQGIMQPEAQKVRAMLNAGLYYVQLVGEVMQNEPRNTTNGDISMTDGNGEPDNSTIKWTFEFKDTPDPGKQAISSRLIYRIPFEAGDFVEFLNAFGYEYVSRYMLVGSNFFDQDTTLFVHKVVQLPQVPADKAISDVSFLSDISKLQDFDGSGGYVVQASIDVVDGNHPELKDRATRQLLAHKEALKQAVDLTPGDRLALDTRLPSVVRKAVASFFKPTSQKEPEKLVWRTVNNSLIVGRYDPSIVPPQSQTLPVKIAAFDLDDTIIVPNTGSKWARSATSWKWWDPSVPGRLKQLYDEGYLVIILSNQGNISLKDNPKSLQRDAASLNNLKQQVGSIFRRLDLPVSLYAATGQDRYRKPRVGMWEEMLEDYDLLAEGAVDMANSFYIGDAAGREKTDRRRKDHATSDRDLAANIGIRFLTPEEFFRNESTEAYEHVFVPAKVLEEPRAQDATTPAPFTKRSPQELVIFCGSPGAGKSTFYWDVLQPLSYERVNQDILKTRDKCIKKAKELLDAGRSVAVDNTNADVETRRYWVNIAREYNVPIRCVRFTASSRLAEHNDAVRALNPEIMNPEKRTMLPGIAFRSFVQRLQEPTLKEGFEEIYKVGFEFKGTEEQKKLWSRYWVSKFST
ncbi:DNA kinase/phosphatase Pnk1 [Exophiala xenobiotica]|nr:DNA kinase/phosphatase Pnk1 [Exophiala xenobiotica]KAK5295136.1 DNA kinase/phosphatase Pnk1 [Exophiala xenobiotica]